MLSSLDEIAAVGHRILHGKDAFKQSAIIDQEALCKLKSFMEFGPLHMPANIMGIESCMSLMEGIPQVGVFDTAFHQTMPKKAFLYAIPYGSTRNTASGDTASTALLIDTYRRGLQRSWASLCPISRW